MLQKFIALLEDPKRYCVKASQQHMRFLYEY